MQAYRSLRSAACCAILILLAFSSKPYVRLKPPIFSAVAVTVSVPFICQTGEAGYASCLTMVDCSSLRLESFYSASVVQNRACTPIQLEFGARPGVCSGTFGHKWG